MLTVTRTDKRDKKVVVSDYTKQDTTKQTGTKNSKPGAYGQMATDILKEKK